MTREGFRQAAHSTTLKILYASAFMWACAVRADQVEMVNGDRYVGHVLSLGSNTLVVQSEVLGTVRLPRARISTITLESHPAGSATNVSRLTSTAPRSNNLPTISATTSTNVSPDFSAAMRQLNANSNVIQQVQQQFLAGAGPEAQAKFNDLVGGLLSGKIDVNNLRAQAKSTLEQARSARKELGEEGGMMMDGYLAILDSFLKETEPANAPTNATAPAAKPRVKNPVAEE